MSAAKIVLPLVALCLSPLLQGLISRTKAHLAGRVGPPLLQPYFDLVKLLRKGAVYSVTTTWIFRAGPMVGLAAVLAALVLTPLGGVPAPLSFAGDFIVLAYFLGLMRYFTVLAALDTGSSFEGMGASREMQFSALTEPVLFLALAALAAETGSLSLSDMYAAVSAGAWAKGGPELLLLAATLFVVFLTENARVPVDDPNTHLELTMVHEVMVLDHGGPDLASILYGAALKLWVLGALVAGTVVPVRTGNLWMDGAAALGGMLGLAVLVGVVESSMARLRLIRVPQFLVGAGALSAFALFLAMR
jgi:formate hydrogenlyase subunit 4